MKSYALRGTKQCEAHLRVIFALSQHTYTYAAFALVAIGQKKEADAFGTSTQNSSFRRHVRITSQLTTIDAAMPLAPM
eukprot:6184022-Pleurochrysis_carterae.AAC.1